MRIGGFKKLLSALFFLCVLSAVAQNTTVSVTVVDSSGQIWTNGTISYVFQNNNNYFGTYQWQGAALPAHFLVPTIVNLDGTGSATFTIPTSTTISPALSSWGFVICPNASVACSTINISTTGSTMNISSQVTGAIAPIKLVGTNLPKAYLDSNIIVTPQMGALYYNVTLPGPKYYDGTTWHTFSGGGGSPIQLTGPVTTPSGTGMLATTITPTITAGTCGDATDIPVITYLASGQLTNCVPTSIIPTINAVIAAAQVPATVSVVQRAACFGNPTGIATLTCTFTNPVAAGNAIIVDTQELSPSTPLGLIGTANDFISCYPSCSSSGTVVAPLTAAGTNPPPTVGALFLVQISCGFGCAVTAPAGWSPASNTAPNFQQIFSKILTSGDISTGTATFNYSALGAPNAILELGTYFAAGAQSIREVDSIIYTSASGTRNLSTSNAVQPGDLIIPSAACLGDSSGVNSVFIPSTSYSGAGGFANTVIGGGVMALYNGVKNPLTSGVQTATFTVTSGHTCSSLQLTLTVYIGNPGSAPTATDSVGDSFSQVNHQMGATTNLSNQVQWAALGVTGGTTTVTVTGTLNTSAATNVSTTLEEIHNVVAVDSSGFYNALGSSPVCGTTTAFGPASMSTTTTGDLLHMSFMSTTTGTTSSSFSNYLSWNTGAFIQTSGGTYNGPTADWDFVGTVPATIVNYTGCANTVSGGNNPGILMLGLRAKTAFPQNPYTENVLKGDGAGNIIAAIPGVDYQQPFTVTTVGSGAASYNSSTLVLNIPTNTTTGLTGIVHNVTSSRTTGTVYQNTYGDEIFISGNANSNTGSSTSHIALSIGTTSAVGTVVWSAENGATVANGSTPFVGMVPTNYYYELIVAGDVGWGASSLWYETEQK